MTDDTAAVDAAARVMAQHSWLPGSEAGHYCPCGFNVWAARDVAAAVFQIDAYRLHVAEALAAAGLLAQHTDGPTAPEPAAQPSTSAALTGSGRADITMVLNDHRDWCQEVDTERSDEHFARWRAFCRCGEPLTDTSNGPSFDDRHRAHVATILAARAAAPDPGDPGAAALSEAEEDALDEAWHLGMLRLGLNPEDYVARDEAMDMIHDAARHIAAARAGQPEPRRTRNTVSAERVAAVLVEHDKCIRVSRAGDAITYSCGITVRPPLAPRLAHIAAALAAPAPDAPTGGDGA